MRNILHPREKIAKEICSPKRTVCPGKQAVRNSSCFMHIQLHFSVLGLFLFVCTQQPSAQHEAAAYPKHVNHAHEQLIAACRSMSNKIQPKVGSCCADVGSCWACLDPCYVPCKVAHLQLFWSHFGSMCKLTKDWKSCKRVDHNIVQHDIIIPQLQTHPTYSKIQQQQVIQIFRMSPPNYPCV